MLQIHLRAVAAVDILNRRTLPQHSVVSVHLATADGRSIELWTLQSRSYPTFSPAEAEGAMLFDDLPEALAPEEALATAMAWIQANLACIDDRSDRNLLYAKSESGQCVLDADEFEFRPTG